MDLDLVAKAYRTIVTALPMATVHYATKCNPHPAVLTRLHDLGCGFEWPRHRNCRRYATRGRPGAGDLQQPVKPIAAHRQRPTRRVYAGSPFDSHDELAKLAAVAPERRCSSARRPRAQRRAERGQVRGRPGRGRRAAAGRGRHGLDRTGIDVPRRVTNDSSPRPGRRSAASGRPGDGEAPPGGIVLRMVDVGGGFPAAVRRSRCR